MQQHSRTLSRPTPRQQPTGPLQLWPSALRMAIPWSLSLLDLNTLELRRQMARLPSKIFYLDYESLRINRILEMAPVQEVCKTALVSHSTTSALNKTNPALATRAAHFGPFDALPAERGHSRARTTASASLPSKVFPRALRALEMGSPPKIFLHGCMQDVCWMTLTLPPPQHQPLANAFDLLLLQPSRLLQPCPRPLLVPAPRIPRLFRLLPLSLVLLCQRARTPP